MSRKRLAILVSIIVAVGVMAIAVAYRRKTKALREAQEEAAAALVASDRSALVPVSSDDPTWGSQTAPVTIILFGDLQCPFLARVAPVLDRVKTQYGAAKVRIVWKNRPAMFHPHARPAALAAHAVFTLEGRDSFWSFFGKALRNQTELGPAAYERWASQQGVDLAKFHAASTNERAMKKLDDDHALLKKLMTPEGPHELYINGVLPEHLELGDFEPTRFDDFRTFIDAQLAVAASLRAAGKPAHYAAIADENAEREARRQRQGGSRAPYRPTPRRVPIGRSPVAGRADAVVTIVEISDFACLECKRLQTTLRRVREKFGDKVRVVWKHRPMPFEPRAEPAAELALEAQSQKGSDGFWQAHDKLFASPGLETADLERIAGELGLDVPRAMAAIESAKHKEQIDADQTLAAAIEKGSWSDTSSYPRHGSVDGGLSPIVCINGMPIVDPADLESSVENAIKAFDQEHGDIAAKDWYERLISRAPAPPVSPLKQARSALWNEGVRLAGDRTRRREGTAGVPRAAIVEAMAQDAAGMRRCHEDGLRSNPALGGRVLVEVVTDRSGAVSLAQDGGSSLPDASVVACVASAVKNVTFPKIEEDAIAFVVVLNFVAVP